MTTGSDAPCDYSTLPSPTSWNCASSTITGSSSVALQSAIVSYAQSDTCAASKARNKRSSCDVGTLGADVIGQTGTGGLFNDLIQFPTGAQLPPLIPAVAVGLSQVVTAGQTIAQLAASSSLLQVVAEMCLWIVYEQLNNLLLPTQPLVIPESDISTSRQPTASTPECPDITAAPNCDDCGGDNGKQLCIGTYNAYTSCPCYHPLDLKWAPFDASEFANMGASFDAMTAPMTTTSSSAAPAEITPMLTCQNYATYYDGSCQFYSVSGQTVNDTANAFTNQYPNASMTSTAGNITQAYGSKPFNLMNVGWIAGCTGPSQVVQCPVASSQSIQSLDLFRGAFYDCK
ncbi:hypothetical protein HO133_001337 [Letharia lupina]|uniref:Uncharacterized protein n=1 Tax=Letharia lupina TaxID=560253 RepID=A0A8H6CFF4_9LECA|nr:uncharacterized protein HO133_001337 [Letharia lupina]KAF6222251.1 hypothetical protein HO133_001337 [Letharia lupina]